MKLLISQGHKKFANRHDCNYLQDLADICITENEAWEQILSINKSFYWRDGKQSYYKNDNNALEFKKVINSKLIYIKLKIEEYDNSEMTVCLSFHIDHRKVIKL